METNNKLYITISDKRLGDGSGTPTNTTGLQQEEKQGMGVVGRYVEHQLFHLVKSTATQAVNFSLSNIGNLTGDYMAQTRVNEMKQEVSNLMSIGGAVLAGAQIGGIYGAAAGFVVGTASIISGNVFQDLSNRIQNAKANYDILQLRARAGLNTTLDGSRGTEN